MNKLYPYNLSIKNLVIFACLLMVALFTQKADAQNFGQNKVRYKNLTFKVYKTPHFEIYYYLKNDSVIKRFAQESELWYTLHQQVFRDTFSKPNPIILYSNHPDFQQSTLIDASVGLGGVTESSKNRVIMPIAETNQLTRHVIGHELVHAFQYHMLFGNDSIGYERAGEVPLWMVEGMAEYLSLGKKDAYTAMWMRDAYLNNDIPTLEALTTSNKYFPYRYGQAFWSFLGSTYGDTIIVPFFKNAARFGLQYGIRRTLGYDDKTLSQLWKTSIQNTYKPFLKDTAQIPVGRKLITTKLRGDITAPSVSPNGKYLTYLSQKGLFSIDLYLADANSGRDIKKLTSSTSNTHIDEFNFIESAGAWSPDSKRFAFSVFSKGRNRMLIIDIPTGKLLDDISMGKAEQFSNLSWSPDGKSIVVQGLSEGHTDLYLYSFDSKTVRQLTNDKYTEYQPSFSKDGKRIVFSTDRATYDKSLSQEITYNLAELDLATGIITDLHIFNGANNLNPQYSADGTQIYFLSNRDGFRNMYRYTMASGKVEQMTNLFTGISGITEYSPALTLSNNDDVLYSYYRAQKFTIYSAKTGDFKPVTVDAGATNFDAAMLPPPRAVGVDLINSNLNNFLAYRKIPLDSIKAVPYKSKFKLDYLGSTGIGASVSSYGAGLSSGIQGVFTDILGRNQIYAGAAINGEIYDFGAQAVYINQQGRWNFGLGVSHIPYQSGTYGYGLTTIDVSGKQTPVYEEKTDIIRTFEDAVQAFASYPIARSLRAEVGTAASNYSYRVDRYSTYYNYITTPDANGNDQIHIGNVIDYKKHKISREEFLAENRIDLRPFSIYSIHAALVGDNSYFGIGAPYGGHRFRLQAEYNVGTYQFFSPTIDLRQYIRAAPVTFAARLYGYGRFGTTGSNGVSGLYPLYVGYPFLIRGYEAQTFYNARTSNTNGFTIDQLSGDRIAVANFEVRLPFTGPEKLAVIKSKFLLTDLNLFFDAGLAWNGGNQIKFQMAPDAQGTDQVSGKPLYNLNQRVPALSAGISLRVNIFGAFILEPYYAIPFNRTDIKKPVFGLTFAPGW
jgi:hypothetical protein